MDRIILCMKWGTAFPPDSVNVLYNACRRAMEGPFRFVCLTDDAAGLAEGIETFPIPQIGLTHQQWYTKGVWPKLALYGADLHGLEGRCLFIDLDMVVLGDLDAFFAMEGRFIATDMGDGWQKVRPPGSVPETGTCIFRFDIGREVQILQAFQDDPSGVMAKFHNEQDFVGAMVDDMRYWPDGWVISFKRVLRQPIGKDIFLPPDMAPPGTKVIAFHGDPRPQDLLRRRGRWDRFPHMGHGRVRWMAEYWLENGGRLP